MSSGPLWYTMGVINLVKMEGVYEANSEYWALIETCSNRLDYYIQKTLQYYRNNKMISEHTLVDFEQLIPGLIELYSFTDRKTTFTVNINQQTAFYGDAFRIEVILGNLISNAIKYQKENETNKKVNINIEVSKEFAEFSIADNGMGILNEHLEKIFTQFFKSSINHGSGLGLFIVKEALNKINGKIAVSSDTEGTTFKITIPNVK
jgi:two-component system response regulator PhcR